MWSKTPIYAFTNSHPTHLLFSSPILLLEEMYKTLEPDDNSQPIERTLGLLWSLKSNAFLFSPSIKSSPNTHSGVLFTITCIFNLLGFLPPFTLKGKNILQDMCRISASWEATLEGELLSRWGRVGNFLRLISLTSTSIDVTNRMILVKSPKQKSRISLIPVWMVMVKSAT
ncbi:hypothetical protein EB796_010477 [Bugula neritina]|uniref:Uncharacterized protein n=1 Tax=Bugula neritina TaxID=10212 RepID=A0A7J7JZZ3_BUGNE|nr:hypothetical protein EB796_010477 [Bugula neritina]